MAKKSTLNKTNPLSVSVVVTILNEAKTIESLLVALQKQTLSPTEILIVDGGSRDETVSLVQRFAEQNHTFPITVFSHPGNRSQSRNAAILRVQTELVAITDAGCVPHNNWLEELVKTFALAASAETVVAGYYDGVANSNLEKAIIPYALVMPDKVNAKTFLPASRSMLLPKKVWAAVDGFDETLSDNEDYDFAHQLQKKYDIIFAPKAKVSWQPRSTLRSFFTMIFRFARGDVEASLIRKKVLGVFARYALGLLGATVLLSLELYVIVFTSGIVALLGYSSWAIKKNYKYVGDGWYWLPVLQVYADVAVIIGSISGVFKWFQRPSRKPWQLV